MPKETSTFDLNLGIRDDDTPAYRWLYDALRREILEGRLRAGARLPSTRAMAAQYGLSRGTVVNAFEMLGAEGYLDGAVGAGSFVSKVIPDSLLEMSRKVPVRNGSSAAPRILSRYGTRLKTFRYLEHREPRAFLCNAFDLSLFPLKRWTAIAGRRLRRVSDEMLLGCDPMGYLPLREAVAGYLASSRGVKCSANNVAIVSGISEALDLIVRLTCDVGDDVCLEDPGYFGASAIFEAAGVCISTTPVDHEGMRIPLHGARLAYVTPGHQFPTGITMSLSRRMSLLKWARIHKTLVFEDDYDSEYRYSGRPLPTMQSLDNDGLVIYAGTFNKVLFPALRVGYLVVPDTLVDCVRAAISITTRHCSLLHQVVLADFIAEGHFARHLRRTRGVYAERLETLIDAATRHLTGAMKVNAIEAGLHVTGWLAPQYNEEAVRIAARKRQVDVLPLNRFARNVDASGGLQLGFSAIGKSEIDRGMRSLAEAIEEVGVVNAAHC